MCLAGEKVVGESVREEGTRKERLKELGKRVPPGEDMNNLTMTERTSEKGVRLQNM